jgi:post-segregation antitoxin (ccd killing protein)
MDFDAVRKLLRPMSDVEFEAWLREHMPEATAEDPDGARWLDENRAALESSNRYVEEHGLPLGKFQR